MLGRTRVAIALVLAGVAANGCFSSERPLNPQDLQRLGRVAPGDPAYNWPLPADEAERRLSQEEFEIRSVKDAGGGVTGAKKFELFFPSDGTVFSVKWKMAPPRSLDGWNNSPRKEIAAYEIQSWFLDPRDYIVPTTVVRCIPIAEYRRHEPGASPNVDGASCVLGVLSLWMNNVTVPEELYDDQLFASDPNYAYHMADFNLLTYLIDHRDGRSGNFLVSKDTADRRVYAVDNGIAFEARIYNYFVPNWNEIEVPALRRAALDRLRRVTFADVHRLGIGVELKLGADGVFRATEQGPNLEPDRGVRERSGVVQLGLTDEEIEEVAVKIADLLGDIDEGDVALF